MLIIDQLKELRKKAEEAVAEMPDGDLKTKAFEVILQHLLSVRSTPDQSGLPEKRVQDKKQIVSPRQLSGAKSRILLLKNEGFFTVPRSLLEVKDELVAHGWVHPRTSLSGPLQSLVQERHLRRLKDQAAKKKVWKYVNP
jgi:hypothetical protein